MSTRTTTRLTRLLSAAASILLAGVALTRASSYLGRPPSGTASTELIESVIDYRSWGLILVAAAGIVCVGVVTHGAVSTWTYFAGHLALMGCYSIFGLSILVAAVMYGAPWTTLGEVVALAVGHTIRVLMVAVDGTKITERER